MEKSDPKMLIARREEQASKARKERREESFKKRRTVEPLSADQQLDTNIMAGHSDSAIPLSLHLADSQHQDFILACLEKDFPQSDLLPLLSRLKTPDSPMSSLLESAIGIRKILCDEDNCPIQALIDANGVPVLIHFMMDTREAHLQLECAWALTNVVCGTSQQTKSVVQQKGIQCFVQLLHHRYSKVAEQAIWALGNIAGDSHIFRDQILNSQSITPLCQLIMHETSPSQLRHQGIWALSNLCRGRPFPSYSLTHPTIPVFGWAINHISNFSVIADAAWALSYLSDGDSQRISSVIATGVVPRLVALLTCPMVSVQIPAMRILGNLMTGTDEQTDTILSAGILPQLFTMLNSDNPAVRREIMWNVSNIAAGTPPQVHLITSQPEYLAAITQILENDVMEVQEESLVTLKNAILKGTSVQVSHLHQAQVMKPLIGLFQHKYLQVVIPAIECVQKLLQAGGTMGAESNIFLTQFQQMSGSDQLEHLQSHPSEKVYELSKKIIEEYFEVEEEQY